MFLTINLYLFNYLSTSVRLLRDRLWVRFPFEEMKYLIYSFSCPVMRRCVSPLKTQCLRIEAESGEGCLNTRFEGSRCVPCYVRDTA